MAKMFGESSTTDEVLSGVNLNGKRVLVAGVSAGLGVETAEFARCAWSSISRSAMEEE